MQDIYTTAVLYIYQASCSCTVQYEVVCDRTISWIEMIRSVLLWTYVELLSAAHADCQNQQTGKPHNTILMWYYSRKTNYY